MKPVINLDELKLTHRSDGPFEERYAGISEHIGAKKLSYSVTVVPPGKKVCPFHNHHANEELFLILEGTGTLRFGDKTYPLRPHDVIACPPGGRGVAHQIINTGTADLRYFCLSTKESTDICEYPDSDKIGAYSGCYGEESGKTRHLFRAGTAVDYMDGEG